MTFAYHPNVATGYVPASEAPTVELRFESIDHDPGELVSVTLCGVEILKSLPPRVVELLTEYRDQAEW